MVMYMDITRIRELREDHDLSQLELSKELGIKRSAYSLWEIGLNIIPIDHLYDLSKFYNVNIDYILRLTNDKKTTYEKTTFDIKRLGKNMRKIRKANGLTQENIGAILEISQAAVNKYEKGIILISLYKLLRFCEEFHVTIEELCREK